MRDELLEYLIKEVEDAIEIVEKDTEEAKRVFNIRWKNVNK